MTEYNIFEIVRSEKKNLSSVSIPQLNKVFVKYYLKFIHDLHYKFNKIQILKIMIVLILKII